MPKRIQINQSGQKVTHDPTQEIHGDPIGVLGKNPYDEMTLAVETGAINSLLDLLYLITGIDLHSLLGLTSPDPLWNEFLDLFVAKGTLTTHTPIPPHLFGNASPGSQPAVGKNLLPDPGFDTADVIDGEGLWAWSGTVGRTVNSTIVGSVYTTGESVLRQFNGVPIVTKAGQTTDFEVWTSWDNVTAAAGTVAISLCANSWDKNHNIIADPQRVVASISDPVLDQPVWQKLSGTHQAPAGTAYVTICLEVTADVASGQIWYDDAVHDLHGVIDASWLGNLFNIPQIPGANVDGMQGIADLITTFNRLFDGLGSALSNAPQSGIDLSQIFSLLQTTAQQAYDAINLAIFHHQVLTTRVNKPVRAGLDPTSESTFHLSDFTAGGTTPLTAVAAGTSIIAMLRVSESAKKGFFEFLAQGNGGSSIFVNVYKVNTTTGVKTALWNSADISALVPNGSIGYVRALIPGASQPTIAAGDLLALGIVNAGAGTLSVGTKQIPAPNHPTAYPPNVAATRTIAGTGGASPASITDSQITYSNVLPYINFGISDVPADYMPPQIDEYFTDGTYTYTIPEFARIAGTMLDLVGIGAGGGGGGSGFYLPGEGGLPGTWNGITLVCGVDYPVGATSLTVIVGNRGHGGHSTDGGSGSVTQFKYTNLASTLITVTCNGGVYGSLGGFANHGGDGHGIGAGDFTFNSQRYFGGSNVLYAKGSYPGGGGSGAAPYSQGNDGADGYASITARQP